MTKAVKIFKIYEIAYFFGHAFRKFHENTFLANFILLQYVNHSLRYWSLNLSLFDVLKFMNMEKIAIQVKLIKSLTTGSSIKAVFTKFGLLAVLREMMQWRRNYQF